MCDRMAEAVAWQREGEGRAPCARFALVKPRRIKGGRDGRFGTGVAAMLAGLLHVRSACACVTGAFGRLRVCMMLRMHGQFAARLGHAGMHSNGELPAPCYPWCDAMQK